MDRLPAEILLKICADLPTYDVPSFRLCCRSWASIGVRYLLPVVRVICSDPSLEALEAIANHPTWSRYVHTLVYSVGTLPRLATRQDWLIFTKLDERSARRWQPDPGMERIRPISDIEIIEGWQSYQTCWDQQTQRACQRLECVLSSSVMKFPALRCIKLENTGDRDVCHFQKALVETRAARRSPHLGAYNETLALRAMLTGACRLKQSLQILQARPITLNFFNGDLSILSHLKDSVKNLQEIHLVIFPQFSIKVFNAWNSGYPDKRRRCKIPFSELLFDGFLTAASHLRRISLEGIFSNQIGGPICLCQELDSLKSDALRELWLKGFCTTEEHLFDLIKGHAETLKEIHLEGITFLSSDTTQDVLSRLRTRLQSNLNFKRVHYYDELEVRRGIHSGENEFQLIYTTRFCG